VGDTKFIDSLKRNRKLMGGVMAKPGLVAGAGLLALKNVRGDLVKDN